MSFEAERLSFPSPVGAGGGIDGTGAGTGVAVRLTGAGWLVCTGAAADVDLLKNLDLLFSKGAAEELQSWEALRLLPTNGIFHAG